MEVFIKKRNKWNVIRSNFGQTIGAFAVISLIADSIQIFEFLNQNYEIMTDLIKLSVFAICTTFATYPISSSDMATYLG